MYVLAIKTDALKRRVDIYVFLELLLVSVLPDSSHVLLRILLLFVLARGREGVCTFFWLDTKRSKKFKIAGVCFIFKSSKYDQTNTLCGLKQRLL